MENCWENINDYKSAFDCFKKRFLQEGKSIFRLDNDDVIFNKDSIQYLVNNFINRGLDGDASFIEKTRKQLFNEPNYEGIGSENENQIQQNAIEVLAHCVWLWRLVPENADSETTKNLVKEILELDNNLGEISLDDNPFFDENIKGFAKVGRYYNTNKPFELAFIIRFLEKVVDNNKDGSEKNKKWFIERLLEVINDPKNEKIVLNIIGELNKNGVFKEINNRKDEHIVSVHNALLHLLDPENYEPIISNDHKKKIVEAFGDLADLSECEDNKNKLEPEIDCKIKKIKEHIKEIIADRENKNKDNVSFSFYDDRYKHLWQGGIGFESKNLVIHGPPGTGKTYLTIETIKARQLIENSEYEIVQFHPGYGYEDFVEGIKPVGLQNGQMQFELKNGIFKEMCIKAFKELKEHPENPKRFYFVADEINRAELSGVFGELLLCLEDDKRLRIENGKIKGALVKTQYSSLWKDKHIVVKVKDDKIDDNGEPYFGVPENIYFIGTMNDIDRSVDSFDMALRRRFVWKKYTCDYDVIEQRFLDDGLDNDKVKRYIKACKNLNKYITGPNGLNLGEDFELGHYYFMKPKKLTEAELERVWNESIEPLLREYLRAVVDASEIEDKLKKAKEKYTLRDKNDNNC